MAQIGGYLTQREHHAFKEYAAEFLLKESGLANLLIARELKARRLVDLRSRYSAGASVGDRARVTAHQSNNAAKSTFEVHANQVGLKPDHAASLIFRAELNEKWLKNAVLRQLESN